MGETVKGTGIVWGVAGVTFTAGIISATTTGKNQSFNLDRTSDKAEIKDGDGEVVGQVFYNAKKVISLTIVPTGTTLTLAATSADAWTPAPGTLITIADADGTILDGSYNLLSAKLRGTNTEARMADIEIEKYDANDVTAVIS